MREMTEMKEMQRRTRLYSDGVVIIAVVIYYDLWSR